MATLIERRISFSGGELSPFVDPRVDLEKYRSGCSELRNFIPNVFGGAFRRPGTIFLGEVKDSTKRTRLEKFEFSVTTTLIIEFGEFYARFWTTGTSPAVIEDPENPGTPFEVETPWSEDQIFQLQFAQLNDLVFIAHGSTRPHVLTRVANNDWSLAPILEEWPASLDDNITMITMEVSGGETPSAYPAWAIGIYDPNDRVSYAGVDYRCIKRISNLEAAVMAPGTYDNWKTFWAVVIQSVTFGIGTTVDLESSDDFFDAGHVGSTFVIKHRRENPTTKSLLTEAVGCESDPTFVLGEWTANVVVNSGGTWEVIAAIQRSFDGVEYETIRTISSSGVTSDLVSGNELEPCFLRFKVVTKTGSPPANASFVLEPSDSFHYGLLKVITFTDSQTVEAMVVFPPYDNSTTKYWNEPAWSDYRGFPRAVTFHENRLMWGGSTYRPQTVWGSIIDDYFNYRVSAEDDGGLSFRLASDAANGIQWIVGQESLIIGTTGSEYTVGTRENQTSLTPSGIAARRSTTYGSDLIQAVVVSDAVLFVSRSGRRVFEFVYTFEEDGYTSNDLTLLSEQITDSRLIQLAVQKNPQTVLWSVTGNGNLSAVVYERGQRVAGWFRFDTGVDGETRDYFESVAVVSGDGEEDEIWVVVRREIDGESKRYVERFQPNLIRKLKDGTQSDLCYSDSAVIKTGSGFTTVEGLEHLEGREVTVLTNGAPESNKTVVGGEITLDFESDTAVVGIPFESVLTPTPLETNDPGTVTKYSMKKVSDLVLQAWQSNGFEATASNGVHWTPVDFRQPNDFMDQAVPLFTGPFENICLDSKSEREAKVSIRQVQPLPLNVLSMYIKYSVEQT